MKYLYITGANGFLGREIIKHLDGNNLFDKIFLIVRNINTLTLENDKFNIITYDEFYSSSSLQEISSMNINKILLHLAFARSTNPDDLMANVRLLDSITRASIHNGINSIINISSQSIYDLYRGNPAIETDFPEPNNAYGVFKFYSESYLNLFSNRYGIPVIHLRLASLVGIGLNSRITTRLLKDAFKKQKMIISSNKEQFSFFFFYDAARMICNIASNLELAKHTVYNIGSFESYSLKSIVEIILAIFKDKQLPIPIVNIKESAGPQFNNSLNLDRMKQDFNLKEEISLKDSLNEILQNLMMEMKE